MPLIVLVFPKASLNHIPEYYFAFFSPTRALQIGLLFCRNIKFNYCILDEGHVIKNGKTKLSKAIKQIAANFRVILSGTPIQVRTFPPL